MKKNQQAQIVPAKVTTVQTQRPSSNNVSKLWQNNVSESQNSTKDHTKLKDIPSGNSAKIKSITQAFEQKDEEAKAEPQIVRRSEYTRDRTSGSPFRKSVDLTDSPRFSSYEKKLTSPLAPNSPNALLPRDQRFPNSYKHEENVAPSSDKVRFDHKSKIYIHVS